MNNNIEVTIAAIAEKIQRKLNVFMLEFTQDLSFALIVNTPYRTGFLRASWYAGLNNSPSSKAASKRQRGVARAGGFADPAGASATGRIGLVLKDVRFGDTVFLVNAANYAKYVEYGTRRMAPRAFVRRTFNEAQAIAQRAAARVSRRKD